MRAALGVYPSAASGSQGDTLSRPATNYRRASPRAFVYWAGVVPRLALALASLVFVAGCGESMEPSALPYPATALSRDGRYRLEATVPGGAPLVRGVHAFDVRVDRAETGAPASGLTLEATPWMPAMGHGSPYDGTSVELEPGHYLLTDVSLFMAGVWELRTAIGPDEDHATLSFDVR
ncbi:MAG: FixH family protein [Deltaproteobacteria bacterium]|nr:FixH family protein [Deltaproteobacteria bacterium]